MRKSTSTALRVLIASAVGLAVFVIACLAAWRSYRSAIGFRHEQFRTQAGIRQICKEIEAYRKDKGTSPQSLVELRDERHLDEAQIVDGWERRFLYRIVGNKHVVLSFGMDGKPGGTGLDSDLSSEVPQPPGYLPTFVQFLLYAPTQGLIATCALSGLLAFVLAYRSVRVSAARRDVGRIAANTIVFSIVTVIAGVVISALHIPSGH